MNNPRLNVLDNFLKEELRSSLRDIIDDSEMKVEITFKNLTASAFDTDTGVTTRTETSDTVNAIARTVSERDIDDYPGQYQEGDRIYLIDQADLTNAPTTQDRVTEGSVTREVVRVADEPLDFIYEVLARLI